MKNARTTIVLSILVFGLFVLLRPAITQQDAADESGPEDKQQSTDDSNKTLPETVVTESRLQRTGAEVTRSVTTVDREQIEQQSSISRDIGDILGKTVPGFATSTEGMTNFTQTMRGRKYLVLMDGVPITTPLKDGQRDLKVLDPEAIERVEIVRGGTSTYGFGATGGVVNYITREPDEERVQGFHKAGFRFSTTHPDQSLQWNTSHGVSGQLDHVDYLLNVSAGERGKFFDSEGNRLPAEPLPTQGGLGDTNEYNILLNGGIDFDEERQRIEISYNDYDIEQNTDLVTIPGDPSRDRTARGDVGNTTGDNVTTENQIIRLGYTHQEVYGSTLDVDAYYQDYKSRFGAFAVGTPFQGQTTDVSEKIGLRTTVETPLTRRTNGPSLVWGADGQNDTTRRPVSGAVTELEELDQDAVAAFAQLKWPFEDVGRLRTGLRHEEFWLDVADFTKAGGGTVTGGNLTYNETLFNINGALFLTDRTELFGGFSQGFSLTDIGRVIARNIPAGGDVDSVNPPGQKVDNYELGLRGNWESLSGSIAGFYSESDVGNTFDAATLRPQRQPQEIWGVESQVDYDVTETWSAGGTATWMDSRADLDGDGSLDEELPVTDVPPVKLTGYIEHSPVDWISSRLQVLYSGDRDPNAPDTFGDADVESYTVFDFWTSIDLGGSVLQFGVENLFNQDYFPVASQIYGKQRQIGGRAANVPGGYTRGLGRTVSINYKVNW